MRIPSQSGGGGGGVGNFFWGELEFFLGGLDPTSGEGGGGGETTPLSKSAYISNYLIDLFIYS